MRDSEEGVAEADKDGVRQTVHALGTHWWSFPKMLRDKLLDDGGRIFNADELVYLHHVGVMMVLHHEVGQVWSWEQAVSWVAKILIAYHPMVTETAEREGFDRGGEEYRVTAAGALMDCMEEAMDHLPPPLEQAEESDK